MSNTEQENSFGGTEGSLFGVEEGQLGSPRRPLSCALLEVHPLTLPPHRPSLLLPALVALLCGKPFS